MKNIFKNKKYTLIISILSVILVLGVTGTYAWYVWTSNTEQRNRIVTSVGAATVVYNDGASLFGQNLKPVQDKIQGIEKEITVRANNASTFNVTFNLYLDINKLDAGLKDESFKFELWKDGNLLKQGNFTDSYLNQNLVSCNKNGTNHIVLLKDATIDNTLSTYKLYIWIDGVNYTNPDTMINQKFSFKLHADGQNAVMSETIYPSGTFMHSIASKYNNSTNKDTVTNGGVTYSYDKDNNLLLDNDGNIRYFGANPNNYVYFNCKDYKNPSSTTCEKWRVIGIVDGKVKIVRYGNIGKYSWDDNSDGSYDNNWPSSSLNNILNNTYYNNLTAATRTNNFISNSTWHINHFSTGNFAHELYKNERTQSNHLLDSKWAGKIALMYPSDYAYAADFNSCNISVYGYNDSLCSNRNWIHLTNHVDSNDSAILLSSNSSIDSAIWRIAYQGNIDNTGTVGIVWNVMPTLYLDEDIISFGGDGSSNSPYKIYPGDKKDDIIRNNLKDYITNLYSSNNPSLIYHKDESGNNVANYYYASSVNLMNDGLGATVTDTTALINGTQGNIRYYGANPNNYIYFNCDDYSNQSSTTCERWRIIGIVDGLVRIIKEESIGSNSWWNSASGTCNNSWDDSNMLPLLNHGYYGSNYMTGIKNEETRNIIFSNTFYLGGHDTSNIYVNNIYRYERGTSKCSDCTYDTVIYPSIGLMYPSDYGYASDLSICNKTISQYYATNCVENNWLYNNDYQWLITPVSSNSSNLFAIDREGGIVTSFSASEFLSVRPVLYLNSFLGVGEKGDGSYNSPYQIVIKHYSPF